jgi:BirA family biotin operon repressor/biotin-[acetyl-CoA-carboxylase] ligase
MGKIDAAAIQQSLSDASASSLDLLEAFAEIDSTNSYLLREPPPLPGRHRVAIAGHQTAGRGRHDREWLSAHHGSLCLSIAYTFIETPDNLPALTLASGVGIVNALGQFSIDGVGLKWPNDIVLCEGKLGGILTETRSSGGTGVTVVVGIGLNIDLPEALSSNTASTWAHRAIDLKSVMASPPAREALSVAIIDKLFRVLSTYASKGFDAFASDWAQLDWLQGRAISVDGPDGAISGIADGVDADGALRVRTAKGTQRINSGSITVEIATELAG